MMKTRMIVTLLLLSACTLAAPGQAPADQSTPSEATAPVETIQSLPGADAPLAPSYDPNFFGAPVSLDSHRASGIVVGTLFAGAGVIGLVRYLDMMTYAHEIRDVNGILTVPVGSSSIIQDAWNREQYLRWVHLGVFGTGELFYAYNAITGISMIPKDGVDTKMGVLHRTAFFVHAGMLVGQVVMGLFLSNALEQGDHEAVRGLGAAHAVIGFAIPLVELTSGIMTNFPELLGK